MASSAHRLKKTDVNRIEVRATRTTILFYAFFLLLGIGIPIVFFEHMSIPVIILSIPFIITGGYGLYNACIHIVFDKNKGIFWKGQKEPTNTHDEDLYQLEEIHSLQVIYYPSVDNNRYQLSLLFKGGKLFNILFHENKKMLLKDANILSEFLKKPIQNSID